MANPKGIISTQDLEVLFTSVSTAFNQMTFDEETIVDKITYLNTNAQGKTTVYPFAPVSNKEKVWPEGQPRSYVSPLVYECKVVHERLDVSGTEEFESTMSYDRYEIIKGSIQGVVERAKRLWDRRLAEFLNLNPTGFDGSPLFDTAHPVNPNNAANGTFTNALTGLDLDQAGFATALNALKQIKWFDGNLMNPNDNGLVLVVPTIQLLIKARQLIFGSQIPFVYGGNTAAAGASNPFMGMKGMVKDVLLLPELQDSTVQDSDKYWYIFNCSNPAIRPVITSIVKQPTFYYAGLNPNDYQRVDRGSMVYGWDATGGIGVGLPQLAIRAKAP